MMSIACTTIFFHTNAVELITRYEEHAENPCGYLTRLNDQWVFVDALATETADWARQQELATAMTEDEVIGISVFMVGNLWALGMAFDGRLGPVAAYVPENADQMRELPERLLAVERALTDLFPGQIEAETIDALFGAVLEGAQPFEDAVTEILEMLGVSPEWIRWAWYETIPEQLFIDPDLAGRVTPIGEACQFWEE